MKFKNETKFEITGLNQEKLLNELCKTVSLSDIDRREKNKTSFKCSYFEHKKVEKFLKSKNVKIDSVAHESVAYKFHKLFTSWGLVVAIVLFAVLYFLQGQYVVQYEVSGVDKLSEESVVDFVKKNYPQKKSQIDTEAIEVGLTATFPRISLVSCMIKGQTMVINIKEKLLPNEMYGDFAPLVAEKDGRITEIELISGTLQVKVGDFVQKGDVLVEPYTIDTSGQLKKVEARAEIKADVYYEGSVDHYQTYISVERTGNIAVENTITLFGLTIYTFKEEHNFKMYEVEYEDVELSKNLVFPFKMKKTYIYELSERVVESNFEDVREEYIAMARESALKNCENTDNIKDEYYTLRHLSGVTIVNYCVVIEEEIQTYESEAVG